MFKPATLRISAIIALVLSSLGLLISILATFVQPGVALSIVSWALLLWAAYLGFRLTAYKLYEDEYKKVGLRIYAIIVAFIAFLFVGVTVGLVLAVVLLGALWGLKKNYDEWQHSHPAEDTEADTL
ncbi:hypothetical protein QMK33_02645 [Hymenobacter sp. H14-R3]|uniref:hypothetical protein n=1 Tax=Hymenobacter sp. H14-R3 TaxID=3046308 RepID=UPI0024BB477E|nr:hypothetical protein [Hymenobacter sp. H14-R3]MDJ0364036.1 hypothetical protein [Hymenobacter sp. H14-R3]